MAEHKIDPHKVTKPIQLLAAWLVGLVLVDAMFLTTALQLEAGWERGCLVAFAIFNVPLFLTAIFVLQTKFRAELQEDSYYADYLSKKTSEFVRVSQASVLTNELRALEETIAATTVKMVPVEEQKQVAEGVGRTHLDWSQWRIALNVQHPRYRDIRTSLREASIPLSEIFGESEGDSDGEAPSRWIISINRKMPTTHKLALLELAMRFNFDGFQFWRPIEEAGETEDVYIGSYGVDNYVALTREFENLLDATFEEADLVAYMKKHRTSGLVSD